MPKWDADDIICDILYDVVNHNIETEAVTIIGLASKLKC
jgi:hypothetical protein